ncbi:MAG: hypothetical protein ACJ757_14380 [Gaiellaceae bacterium]
MLGSPQIQDFYVAGGGCDLGGAFLLARGLINRPAELTRLAGSFWGSNSYQAVDVAKNRLDALAGLLGIGAGFTLAIIGYLASLASPHSVRTGTTEVLVGAALALLALALTTTTGHLYRRSHLLSLLIEMSRFTMKEERMDWPRAALLPHWMEALGHERHEGEDDRAYVRRVAKVNDLTVDVSQTAEFPYARTRRASEPPLRGEPLG